MKLGLEAREILAQGHVQSREFELEASAHLLQVLSGLYSNIPLAIVREYLTNVLDGYTKLLRENPNATIRLPEVHLPSRMAPYFEVKDFGFGMPFGTVWEVFTKYGASTKRDNNEEIGGLGLGSKTAFCYPPADPWIVESRFGGTRMVFHAAKNNQHIPTLNHIGDFPTDEPNGVTIRIPVSPSDFSAFEVALRQVLAYFPMDVNISGSTTFKFKKPEYQLTGTGWGIRKRGYYDGPSTVVMGNVPYPVPGDELVTAGLPRELVEQYALDLRVPVDGADFVPSREALMYTDRTRATLAQCVTTFFDEYKQYVEKNIQNAPTKWEALQGLYEAEGIPALRKQLQGLQWRGQLLSLHDGIRWWIKPPQQEPSTVVVDASLMPIVPNNTINLTALFEDIHCEQYTNTDESYKKNIRRGAAYSGMLRPVNYHFWVVVNDLPSKGLVERVRQFMQAELNLPRGGGKRWGGDTGVAYIFTGTDLTREALSEALEGVPVMLTSEMPEPYLAKKIYERRKTLVKRLHGESWTPIEVGEEDGGYYVQLEGHDNVIGVSGNAWFLASLIKAAKALHLIPADTELYGIPRTLKRLEKLPNWKPFVSDMETLAKQAIRDGKRIVADAEAWEPVLRHRIINILERMERERLPQDIGQLFEQIEVAKAMRETAEHIKSLARMIHMEIPTVKASNKPKQLLDRIVKRYPMFAVLADNTTYLTDEEQEVVYTYLNSRK